ncbi:hypothetical protein [Aliiroseovarius sp. PrR006]|uniref:hypothetical protein n=1 Tax=Aliiroseovarius sp. PrR006 TaxID=2706883 RepID=UPI0013D46BA0|nr:hypothetical protein [Aliiroseovarius sp. PrR006]NDW52841.1 hypothetical protein [Aliiroseovarius sp. PrR006]
MNDARHRLQSGAPLIAASLFLVVGLYLVYQLIAYSKAGAFEFPLDDVYIHLAMSEQIAAGGYGVNAGEYTSAASSPLYPFLLVPFAGTSSQIWVAVFWNVFALVGATVLWVRITLDAVSNTRMATLLALLGPLAFNLAGITMVAMEHTLHVLAVMATLRGVQIYLNEGRVNWLLFAGTAIGVLIRFEGLAVSGAAGLLLAMTGRWKAGGALFGVSVALVGAFMAFLMSLGLEPFPNSVMSKISGPTGSPDFAFQNMLLKLKVQLRSETAIVMAVAVIVAAAMLPRVWRSDTRARAILAATVFTGSAQLLLGQFGWFERYELYAMSFVFGMLLLVVFTNDDYATMRTLFLVGMVFLAGNYTRWMLKYGTWGPSGILAQQQNASTFVKEYYKKPIAVNDLGLVAWGNPNYVLDLWGLASYRALKTRMENPYDGWTGDLTDEANIDLAIVYDGWFEDGLGKNWVKVGTLRYSYHIGFLGGRDVSYYATRPEAAPELRRLIAEFSPNVVGPAEMWVEPKGQE